MTAHFRGLANLRCAAVALACERFRLGNGRWPKSLAEIPAAILAEIPRDPFDGKPLQFVQRADGVTIYSIGADEEDNGGRPINESGFSNAPGTDICFRLYDPAHRRKPPLPIAPLKPFDP